MISTASRTPTHTHLVGDTIPAQPITMRDWGYHGGWVLPFRTHAPHRADLMTNGKSSVGSAAWANWPRTPGLQIIAVHCDRTIPNQHLLNMTASEFSVGVNRLRIVVCSTIEVANDDDLSPLLLHEVYMTVDDPEFRGSHNRIPTP